MDFIAGVIASILSNIMSPEYQALLALVLAFIVGLEQWLASNSNIKSNSTFQLIAAWTRALFLAWNKPKVEEEDKKKD